MSIFAASIGLIICIAGAGALFILARRKKQKRVIFFAALICLAAIFLTGNSFDWN